MKSGAVAFLDILGFKGIWATKSEQDILDLLLPVPQVATARYKEPGETWPSSQPPEVTILSDTIVVTVESENASGLLLLCNIICEIYTHLLHKRMFARGAITWGQFTQSGSVFLGPAIDDAAAWHEQADWIGVIATPKASYYIDRLGNRQFKSGDTSIDPFFKYDVPLKNGGTINLNAFNWPGFLQVGYKDKPESGIEKTLVGCFSEQAPFGADVHRKYENTLKFVRHALR